MKADAIVTMANLMYCRYYRQINTIQLIDDILTICRMALMMEDVPGLILFDWNTNNFTYKNYEQTNQPN